MADEQITWTPEAEEAMKQVPPFAQETARTRIEDYARQRGQNVITAELLGEVMSQFGPGGGRPPGGA